MNWLVITLIAMLIMLGVTTILFVLARAFKLREVENWAKGEYIELLATAFIIWFVLSGTMALLVLGRVMAVAMITHVIPTDISPYVGNAPSYLDPQASSIELMSTVADSLRGDYSVTGTFAIVLKFLRETKVDIGKEISLYSAVVGAGTVAVPILAGGLGAAILLGMAGLKPVAKLPLAGAGQSWMFLPIGIMALPIGAYFVLSALPGTFMSVAQIFSNLLFLQYFSIELIRFSGYLAAIILPTGIAMRAFPGTRGIGAMFIAISLGLLFIFPLSYQMLMFVSGVTPMSLQENALKNDDAYKELNEVMDITCLDPSAIGIFKDTLFAQYQEGKIDTLLSKMNGRIKDYFLIVFVFPAAALTIAYTFMRSFGMMLGADLGEIGKGLIKFL